MKSFREFVCESIDVNKIHSTLYHPETHEMCRYKDGDGNKFYGISVNDLPSALRGRGHKAGRDYQDEYHLKNYGFNIKKGQYDQGAKPTGKLVSVVHAYDHGSEKHQQALSSKYAHAKDKLSKCNSDDTFAKSIYQGSMDRASEHHKSIFGSDLK